MRGVWLLPLLGDCLCLVFGFWIFVPLRFLVGWPAVLRFVCFIAFYWGDSVFLFYVQYQCPAGAPSAGALRG
jgi:hypothetical protein